LQDLLPYKTSPRFVRCRAAGNGAEADVRFSGAIHGRAGLFYESAKHGVRLVRPPVTVSELHEVDDDAAWVFCRHARHEFGLGQPRQVFNGKPIAFLGKRLARLSLRGPVDLGRSGDHGQMARLRLQATGDIDGAGGVEYRHDGGCTRRKLACHVFVAHESEVHDARPGPKLFAVSHEEVQRSARYCNDHVDPQLAVLLGKQRHELGLYRV